MKREVRNRGFFLFGVLIILVLSIVSVYAAGDRWQASGDPNAAGPFSMIIDTVANLIETSFRLFRPLFEIILGSDFYQDGSSDYTFSQAVIIRFLIFVILFAVLWGVTDQISFLSDNLAIKWISVIAISILATRWMNYGQGFIEAVLLPYSAMGMTMTAFLPFIVFFAFVEWGIRGRMMRRFAWIFFAIVMFLLWFTVYGVLDSTLTNPATGQAIDNSGGLIMLIYPAAALLALACAFFDPQIQTIRHKMNVDRIVAASNQLQADKLQQEINRQYELLEPLYKVASPANSSEIKSREARIERMTKKLASLKGDS